MPRRPPVKAIIKFNLMPKIYQYLNFIISFYTNDHFPVHVHVKCEDKEMKIEFHYSGNELTLKAKKVKGKSSFSISDIKVVMKFLRKYNLQIVEKWNEVFIFNQKASCEIIREKL